MNPQTVSLIPDNVFHSLDLLKSSKKQFGIFETSTSFSSNVQNNNLGEECLNTYLPFKENDAVSEDKFGKCDFVSLRHNLELNAEVSWSDHSFKLNTQNNHSAAELGEANLPMEEQSSKPESKITTSGLKVKFCDCSSNRNVSDKCIVCYSELHKDAQTILAFEVEKDLQESECAVTELSKSVVKRDSFQKSMSIHLQTDEPSSEYGLAQSLVESVQSRKYENLMTQNYAENNVLQETSDKLENLPNSNDSFEESFLEKYPIEAENYLQELVESEFCEENIQVIDDDKVEKDLLNDISSTIKVDDHEPSQCNSEEEVCTLEFLCSVFEFLHENEENDNSFIKEQNISISSRGVVTKDGDSNPYCVRSVNFLLSCLNQVNKDLMEKENEALKLKLHFETNANELVSIYNLNKTKDNMNNEFQDLVNSCDKLLSDIKKDRIECELYLEKVQTVLNFFQMNCLKQK